MLWDVVIPHTRLDELTYSADDPELGRLSPGDCVRVRLRGRPAKAIVLAERAEKPVPSLLEIEARLDQGLVPADLLALVRRVARRYRVCLGEALGAGLPRGICGYRPRQGTDRPGPEPAGAGPGLRFAQPQVGWDRFGVFCTTREQRFDLVLGFITAARERGSAVVLMPEPVLGRWLPGLVRAFGSCVVEFHSRLSQAQQKRAWLRIRRQGRSVVAGTRSAVFAPVPDLSGLVVVDGHSEVFWEERRPSFHTEDVAVARAELSQRPVLLCDRVPRAEAWRRLETGAYTWLDKPESPSRDEQSFVVDMRLHRGELLSPRMVRELEQVSEEGMAVLYLNRRGVSRHVVCEDCGEALSCPECGLVMVLVAPGRLSCACCGIEQPAPERCPSCQGAGFRFRAPGLKLVAQELARRFPRLKVSTFEAEGSSSMPTEPGSAVVGTRALFGLEWPQSTRLVAAVYLDYDLVLPDFRVRERAFRTVFELVRRSRRLGARLVVQTRRPEDPAVRFGMTQDRAGFYTQELEMRAKLGYPPFSRLALVEFSGAEQVRLSKHAERVQSRLARFPGIEVLGPVQARGRKPRFRILVKAGQDESLNRALDSVNLKAKGIKVRVGVDPRELV